VRFLDNSDSFEVATLVAMQVVAVAWTCSIALILLTISMHVAGIGWMAVSLRHVWQRHRHLELRSFLNVSSAILTVIVVALILAVLHVVESFLWALVYLRIGVLVSPTEAILYSVGSMATRGSTYINVLPQWRIMGALESYDGILLFGISTAFLFALLRDFWNNVFSNRDI
jgi:hypothetical protein